MSKRILISDGNDQKEEQIQGTSSLSANTNFNSFDFKFVKGVTHV